MRAEFAARFEDNTPIDGWIKLVEPYSPEVLYFHICRDKSEWLALFDNDGYYSAYYSQVVGDDIESIICNDIDEFIRQMLKENRHN